LLYYTGAIELSILSKHYQTEIAVVDTESGRVDRFGKIIVTRCNPGGDGDMEKKEEYALRQWRKQGVHYFSLIVPCSQTKMWMAHFQGWDERGDLQLAENRITF